MQRFIDFLKTARLPGAQLVHHRFLRGRGAVHGTLSEPLSPHLRGALAHLGISRLYRHQAEALAGCRRGENVVIATPTASGKSLVYNLALMETLGKAGGETRGLLARTAGKFGKDILPVSKEPRVADDRVR